MKGSAVAVQVRFKRAHTMQLAHVGQVSYYPGDFAMLASGVAAKLIERGVVEAMKPVILTEEIADGLLLVAPSEVLVEKLRAMVPGARVEYAPTRGEIPMWLDEAKVLVWWDGTVPAPTLARVIQGAEALRRGWAMALPFADYKMLAEDVGSDDERTATRGLILDLRVPVLSASLLFLTPAAREWVEAWLEEDAEATCAELPVLRALWRTMPLYLPLPATWAGADV